MTKLLLLKKTKTNKQAKNRHTIKMLERGITIQIHYKTAITTSFFSRALRRDWGK